VAFQKYLADVGFDSKIDAEDSAGVLLLAVNYYLNDVAGAWLLGIDDRGYQDGVESDCGVYPRVCSFMVNMHERFEHAGKVWCRYVSRTLGNVVKCAERDKYVDIYIVKSGLYRVDIRWGEKDVLDAVRKATDRFEKYFYGFL
jgi:hypothetical protein